MKTFFLFLLLVCGSTIAFAGDIPCPIPGITEYRLPNELGGIVSWANSGRTRFQSRTMFPVGGWSLAFNIESNFRIPLIGSQNYFGKIFFKKGETTVRYRDEQIAKEHYRDEVSNPNQYNTNQFTIARMNRPDGYEVSTGVRLYGRNFNSNTGGRLTIAVKPPGGNRLNIPVDITVVNGRAVPAIDVGGRRIVFDSLKINAKGGSLFSGLENIQLMSRGQVVHTITN